MTALFSLQHVSGSARSVYFISCRFPREGNVQTILSAVAVSILCFTVRSVEPLLFEDLKSEKATSFNHNIDV